MNYNYRTILSPLGEPSADYEHTSHSVSSTLPAHGQQEAGATPTHNASISPSTMSYPHTAASNTSTPTYIYECIHTRTQHCIPTALATACTQCTQPSTHPTSETQHLLLQSAVQSPLNHTGAQWTSCSMCDASCPCTYMRVSQSACSLARQTLSTVRCLHLRRLQWCTRPTKKRV